MRKDKPLHLPRTPRLKRYKNTFTQSNYSKLNHVKNVYGRSPGSQVYIVFQPSHIMIYAVAVMKDDSLITVAGAALA